MSNLESTEKHDLSGIRLLRNDPLFASDFHKAYKQVCESGSVTRMSADVLLFMAAFDQWPRRKADQITLEDFHLAEKLMDEEIRKEMVPAFQKLMANQSLENLTAFVDGALDSIYVILWTLAKFNVPIDKCWDEIQRSNMSKLNPDGTFTKNEFGKVQKPEGWNPPDLFGILMDHFVGEYKPNGVQNGA